MHFMRCVKKLSLEDHLHQSLPPAMDGLSNLSKRKLGRRDATGFKKLPHSDDLSYRRILVTEGIRRQRLELAI
jgi:hypothetical protein